MRAPRISPTTYRRVTLLALVLLAVIIVTGGAVRLSGSGLGCPTWPRCDASSVVHVDASDQNKTIESLNRTFTGLVSVAVMLAVLGSLWRTPRRRDLTRLSLGLVAGVLGQIVLGGLTVLFDLAPPLVMAHFIVSMFLIADAVVLHHRAGQPDGRGVPIVAPEVITMSRWLVVATGIVVFTGTVVTGAGPHAGDDKVARLDLAVSDIARVHGIAENVFLIAVLLTLWMLHRTSAPARPRRDGQILLAVLVAQGAVGYTQYFTGVPALLVGAHIFGAVVVWVAVLRFTLRLRVVPEPVAGSGATVASVATAAL
ncbi:MAG: COX15/CtaA family protein [Acidimicrobiales bacterium]